MTFDQDNQELQYLFDIFDDYFFQGLLGAFVTVQWVDYNPDSTADQTTEDVDNHDRVPINMVRLPGDLNGAWTRSRAIRLLSGFLLDMADAMLGIFSCACVTCECYANNVSAVHAWVELCEAIEDEANRSFRGLEGRWDLSLLE